MMGNKMRCEDFPCCGHQEPDGSSFCPDEDGRFDCVLCMSKLPKGNSSSICNKCLTSRRFMDPFERECQDRDWNDGGDW